MPTIELPEKAERAREPLSAKPVAFHLSLNVSDLDRSIAFYRTFFDREPAKCYSDYAKFELTDPPLALSLEPQPHAAGGALNHLGFRLPTSSALVEMQRRIESSGLATTREEGVECCYARQTKFWVNDPDRNNWEVYVVEADTDHRGAGKPPGRQDAAAAAQSVQERRAGHKLGEPFPAAIPLADGSADEVLLRGTFNAPLSGDQIDRILAEARRVLREGGKLLFHGLVGDQRLNSQPRLPGPAAAVTHVPLRGEIVDAVARAGFAGIHLQRLSAAPVLRHDSIALREMLLEALRCGQNRFQLSQVIMYKGPLAQVADDNGVVYPRGEAISVPTGSAELLRQGGLAESFVFFPPGAIDQ